MAEVEPVRLALQIETDHCSSSKCSPFLMHVARVAYARIS